MAGGQGSPLAYRESNLSNLVYLVYTAHLLMQLHVP